MIKRKFKLPDIKNGPPRKRPTPKSRQRAFNDHLLQVLSNNLNEDFDNLVIYKNNKGDIFNPNKLKEGDIIGVSARGFAIFGKPIQWLTKSKYNHVGIIVQDQVNYKGIAIEKEWFVYEAMNGFIKTPLSEYIKQFENNKVLLTVKRTSPSAFKTRYEAEKRRKIACERAKEALGTPYDKGAIVGLFFIAIFKPLIRKVKSNWFNSKNKIICSEAICQFYHWSKDKVSIFIGKKDKKAKCSTIAPVDIMKSERLFYITGTKGLK